MTASAPGSLRTFSSGKLTWIGGVDAEASGRAEGRAGTSQGLTGCIRNFRLGRRFVKKFFKKARKTTLILFYIFRPVSLSPPPPGTPLDPAVKMRKNVRDCEENPCVRMPCENGGACGVGAGGQGFKCTCKADFTGELLLLPLLLLLLLLLLLE